ncbi:MAG: hypothetical protein K1W01_03375 [Muribaculaceae bacterium]
MRKILFTLLLFLGAMLVNTSCSSDDDDDIIWDFYPITLNVEVVDESGNNLLDPSCAENILSRPITLTHDGETTPIEMYEQKEATPNSRAYLARWYGAYIIGEWDAFSKDDSVKLNIDGKEYELSFTNSYKAQKHGAYDFDRKYYIDDQANENRNYKIVLNLQH